MQLTARERRWLAVALMMGLVLAPGCGLLGSLEPEQVSLGLEGQLPPYQLEVGEEAALVWQVRSASGAILSYSADDFVFGSSSSDVATVEYSWNQDPYVRARRAGECTISAVLVGEGVSGNFTLTVLP